MRAHLRAADDGDVVETGSGAGTKHSIEQRSVRKRRERFDLGPERSGERGVDRAAGGDYGADLHCTRISAIIPWSPWSRMWQ